MNRFTKIAIAIDQLIGAVFVGTYPDETLSAYCHRTQSPLERYLDAIFFWDENHCRTSFQSELERRQLPPQYRR